MSGKVPSRIVVLAWAVAAVSIWACRTVEAGPRRKATAPDALQTGIQLYTQKRWAECEAALRGAAGAEAAAYLSACLAKQKKFAEAEGSATTALAANPTHPVAVAGLGESLVGQKKYDDAIGRLTRVIAAKADVAYAYFWRGMAYYSKKQPDKMVGDFETFLKLAPTAPEAATVQQLLASFK